MKSSGNTADHTADIVFASCRCALLSSLFISPKESETPSSVKLELPFRGGQTET